MPSTWPFAVTDLVGFHDVMSVAEVKLGWLVSRGGPLWLAMSLEGPVRLMLAAMIRGGNDDQKAEASDADEALRYLLPGLSEKLGVHRKSRRTV